jgi:predicted nucleic acid-binding protein
VILVDTGPLVALFDPRADSHDSAAQVLARVREPLTTTIPVLAEVFHLLGPSSRGSDALRTFVARAGVVVWYLSPATLKRAFELMEEYADHPMDLADASLVTAAESLKATKIFTIDRNDFTSYRALIGRRLRAFTLVD